MDIGKPWLFIFDISFINILPRLASDSSMYKSQMTKYKIEDQHSNNKKNLSG